MIHDGQQKYHSHFWFQAININISTINISSNFVDLVVLCFNVYFLNRLFDWRPCSTLVPRSYGRVSGHTATRSRRRSAQVRETKTVFASIRLWHKCILVFSFMCSDNPFCFSSPSGLVLCVLRIAQYESGAVCSQARSLWRLEPLRIRQGQLLLQLCDVWMIRYTDIMVELTER